MKFFKNLFGGKSTPDERERLVLIFIPALVVILKAAETKKGSPLAEEEVLSIRENAVCMAVTIPTAIEMEKKRGYPDIAAESVWEDWQTIRDQK